MADNYQMTGEQQATAENSDDYSDGALVPLRFVGSAQPGDTVSFKVKHLYEDEAELEPVESGEREEEMPVDTEIDELAAGNAPPQMRPGMNRSMRP